MGLFLVNPRYALHLWRLGLRAAPDFLGCAAGHKVSGHRHRSVTLLNLQEVSGFLKRQFRISWKERLGAWRGGYGWVSQSRREWETLCELHEHGLAPEPMAVGEASGAAFVLVRALPEAIDLPTFLTQQPSAPERQRALCRLAEALARLHALGFTHPDLYAKHVFLRLSSWEVSFVDFQRTRRHAGGAPVRSRCRDLAALDASLPAEAVSPSERLRLLRTYLEHADTAALPLLGTLARRIARRSRQLQVRPKLQRLRKEALRQPSQPVQWSHQRVALPQPSRGVRRPAFAATGEA